jgi:predicted regulator of Ras-like GTPase activity (Roadblock/LC7/MglB family)
VDVAQPLAELKEISAQVQEAVIFSEAGALVGSTLADDAQASRMAEAAFRLLEEAGRVAANEGKPLVQIEASLDEGSVAVVREGEHAVAATTVLDPTIGLVFYDLRTCLRALSARPPEAKKTRAASSRKKAKSEDDRAEA